MRALFFILIFFSSLFCNAQHPAEQKYLGTVIEQFNLKWPKNRTVNFVFHGHSVPSGYFATPNVNTLEAYPHLVLAQLKQNYPYAVLNVIVTAIGGENSVQGEERFDSDVLTMRPDVLFIDYVLNDRQVGLEQSKQAWEKMIVRALEQKIKVVLLTPTPDLNDKQGLLIQYAEQIRGLAEKHSVELVDSYAAFCEIQNTGQPLKTYMSQGNHPNEKGHKIVAELIMDLL